MSDKTYTLIVNTREKTWIEKKISYEQIIVLAFGNYSNDENTVYTVTYSRGEKPKHEGSLVKGLEVTVKEGMVFNVTQTNKS
jgi:hypothetical protein